MNPDKLFDYLDGNLNAGERAELERSLTSDSKLQRELAIARQIHKGMRGSREVVGVSDDLTPRSSVLGPRVAAAFGALVLVNVFVGIAFIVGKERHKPENLSAREAEIRQQLSASLQKTAETTLPAPSIANEITLFSSPSERGAVADKVVAAAAQCGGSAAKALPDEKSIAVIVDLPANREREFREILSPLGDTAFSATTKDGDRAVTGKERTLIQVRILDRTAP